MPPSTTKSIVIVDDEKSYTDLLTQILSDQLDCPVFSFSTPLEALQALAAANPGVVVTDYYMPEINGLEFIRQASEVVPQAVFVLISGHNLSAEVSRISRLGALKAFLPKPFGWQKLLDEVVRVWPAGSPAPKRRDSAG